MMLSHEVLSVSVQGHTVVLDVNLLLEHLRVTLTSGYLLRLRITLVVSHLSLQPLQPAVCCSIKALQLKVIVTDFRIDWIA
jgi:hypothetical protein